MKKKDTSAVSIGLLLVFTANMAFAYLPALAPVASFASPLATGIHNYPKHLANYDAYHQIHADLLAKTHYQPATVYIVGEGDVLNPEYFRRIDMPAQDDAAYAMTTCTADLREYWPVFLASLVFIFPVAPRLRQKVDGAGKTIRTIATVLYPALLLCVAVLSMRYIGRGLYTPVLYFSF